MVVVWFLGLNLMEKRSKESSALVSIGNLISTQTSFSESFISCDEIK
jgi:hypothetical protein